MADEVEDTYEYLDGFEFFDACNQKEMKILRNPFLGDVLTLCERHDFKNEDGWTCKAWLSLRPLTDTDLTMVLQVYTEWKWQTKICYVCGYSGKLNARRMTIADHLADRAAFYPYEVGYVDPDFPNDLATVRMKARTAGKLFASFSKIQQSAIYDKEAMDGWSEHVLKFMLKRVIHRHYAHNPVLIGPKRRLPE